MNCLSFDVGGSTVKYGVIDESFEVSLSITQNQDIDDEDDQKMGDIGDNIAVEMVSVLSRKSEKVGNTMSYQEGTMITQEIFNGEDPKGEII